LTYPLHSLCSDDLDFFLSNYSISDLSSVLCQFLISDLVGEVVRYTMRNNVLVVGSGRDCPQLFSFNSSQKAADFPTTNPFS
jgi:hypothetical protein